ncbi:immunoglobulin domain-containing protein, partial [Flavobacterium fluviatile]|uniref:immunoglobulin domain-containing protein n=1 Tax=Flavobacterium fluviatile TaxID=1862387 RepID=UPI0013CFFBEC
MQKLYIFILLFFLFLTANKISAQTFQYDWTDAHGDNSINYTYNYYYGCGYSSYYYTCLGSATSAQVPSFSETKLSVNQNNETIFTGTANRTFDVDSGPSALNISPSNFTASYPSYYNFGYTLSNNESFIGKRKNDGSIAWAGFLKATINNQQSSNNIIGQAVTPAGDVIIAGTYFVPTNLNIVVSSPSFVVNPVSQGVQDIFIAKYNGTTGELIWGKSLGTNAMDLITDLALDSSGNIILAGHTNGSNLDLDTGTGTQIIDGQTTGRRSFIAKYDSNFNFIWKLERVYTAVSKIKIDGSNNVYEFSNYYGAAIDLNGTGGVTNFTSNGTHSFISKYSSSGNYIWTKEIKKDDNTFVYTSIADAKISNNSIYFILDLNSSGNSADLNPNPAQQNLVENDVATRTIVQWNTDGDYIWNLPVYNTFSNSIYNLDVNENDEILFADYNYTGYDIDPTSGVLTLSPGNVYWIKLNADHTVNFASPLRFPSSRTISDIIYDNAGNVILGGNSVTATANLNAADLSENSFLSQNVGERNYFITQYKLNCTTIAPTADAAQIFCNAATVGDLSATGTAIKWYASSTLGSELPSTTALVSGTTYYASQTLNSCESTNRTAVAVTINTTAAPTATATQSFCNA